VTFVLKFADLLTTILTFALFARAIISWFPGIPRTNPLVEVLYQITEPVLAPIRRVLPSMGSMDFSPLVAFFLLQIIRQVLLGL